MGERKDNTLHQLYHCAGDMPWHGLLCAWVFLLSAWWGMHLCGGVLVPLAHANIVVPGTLCLTLAALTSSHLGTDSSSVETGSPPCLQMHSLSPKCFLYPLYALYA